MTMPLDAHDEARLRRYLLRTLPEEERDELEAQVLRDDALFEELEALEDELFHDYAHGRLADGERRDFERSLLAAPGAAERVEHARALLARLAPAPSRSVRWSAPAWLAAAAVVIALGAAWLWRGAPAAPPQAAHSPAAPPSVPPAPSAAPPSAAPAPVTRVASLALAPGLLRGSPGPLPRLTLGGDVGRVRLVLSLPLEARAPAYDALLRTAEGRTVWKGSGLRPEPRRATLIMELPADALPEGDYELVLAGAAGAPAGADYRFRLLRD
jgi:hypothetical protein